MRKGLNREERCIYNVWTTMRARCNNPFSQKYYLYGKQGIKVCERWNSFDNFIADMGLRPTPEHQIERRNNNEGYNPNNCVWATRLEQGQNKSDTVYVMYKGERLALSEVSRRSGIKYSTLYMRWYRGHGLAKAVEMG